MKKGKLFLRHRYGKAEQMALDPDSPRTAEQKADIPQQTDCDRKGPQFDQSALTDVRLRS
jgi:hypothetical protein